MSSILAWGTKIFIVPGKRDFSSFQVENVHWKCMCAAHLSVSLKLIKIKIKLIYATMSSWEKKNGGWKLSDNDWFYFSFHNPSCFLFMIWVDPSPILFYFYFFIRSKLVRVNPSWSGPTFVPACCVAEYSKGLYGDLSKLSLRGQK